MGGTVVRGQARRRWAIVAAVVAVLCLLPAAARVRSVRTPAVDPAVLRDRITASTRQPHHGYAQSAGALGLPALPGLSTVTALLSGTTELRTWYAAADRWRVDVVGAGTEQGLYQTADGQYLWDYGDNQLTRVVGRQPVRLPRPADLTPPDLSRRLLSVAAGDRLSALPGRRVAGIAAAGLRIVPATAGTTVAHIDIWAEPRTGLPLQAEVTARGGSRPVFVTRFLELHLSSPAADVVTPPVPPPGAGYAETETPDVVSAVGRWGSADLPDSLAGQARRATVADLDAVGTYGTGLAQFVVLAVPGRIGYRVYEDAVLVGRELTFPDGDAALVATGLLSMLIVRGQRTYLVAGLVEPTLMERVAADLAGAP
ncbi:MAG TPA: hypothetical protein VF657_15100 [Actinoplanes sp.]